MHSFCSSHVGMGCRTSGGGACGLGQERGWEGAGGRQHFELVKRFAVTGQLQHLTCIYVCAQETDKWHGLCGMGKHGHGLSNGEACTHTTEITVRRFTFVATRRPGMRVMPSAEMNVMTCGVNQLR
jgi:hypothetical protein